jgi:hypothetical protein
MNHARRLATRVGVWITGRVLGRFIPPGSELYREVLAQGSRHHDRGKL